MKSSKTYNYLEQYIISLQSSGKLFFSLSDVKKEHPGYSSDALKLSLNRLSSKNKILSIYKGFYIIIPPEYSTRKIIPPELFVDQLFAYLQRPYYVGLLSAAAMHGASHQQAMEYFVFIGKPPVRPTEAKGLKINYVVKNPLPKLGIVKRKTDTGYLNISSPVLTAVDLVAYQNRIGGLNRASSVLYELSDSISASDLQEILNNNIQLSVLQRLGYILEFVLDRIDLARIISDYLSDKHIFKIPLKPGKKSVGFEVSEQWKVIQNFKIETDFV